MLARYLAGTDFEDFTDITPYECLIDEVAHTNSLG